MKTSSEKMCAIVIALCLLVPGIMMVLGTDTGSTVNANQVFDSEPTTIGEKETMEPANQPPVAVIGQLLTGYKGTYYNLPGDHPEVEGNVTGVVKGDSPYNHDWYDAQYFSFKTIDANLTFGSSWFPVDEGLDGDPYYFAVHWQANISVPANGQYSFLMGSDDDSWLYIDDIMVIDLGGVHALNEEIGHINLTAGVHALEIFFAERHVVESGFYFEFLDPGVEVVSTVIWDDIVADIGDQVFFEGACSYDVDGSIQAYEWDFADGGSSLDVSPTYAYSESGTYTVTLTVTDDQEAKDTDTCLVTITNQPPVADAGQDQTAYASLSVDFDGSDSYDVGGEIVDHHWQFGDGTTGFGTKPSHTFSSAGTYTVTLTVTDNEGATDTDTCQVVVLTAPDITYTIQYLNPADLTKVDAAGIHFYTSGVHPHMFHTIPFNQSFTIPPSDYGTYYLYNGSKPLHFKVTINNNGGAELSNLMVKTIQERHNDVTIWDSLGEIILYKGQVMEGNSTEYWCIPSLAPGESATLEGHYFAQGRGWGLDQTHLIVKMNSVVIVDDPEAGVYCPP